MVQPWLQRPQGESVVKPGTPLLILLGIVYIYIYHIEEVQGNLSIPFLSVRPLLLENLLRCWKMNGWSMVLLEEQLCWRQSTWLDGNYQSRKITARRWLHKYVGAECGASSFTWYLYQMCNTDVRPGFPTIIWKSNYLIYFRFHVCICLLSVQNLFIFGSQWPNFGPLVARKWLKMGQNVGFWPVSQKVFTQFNSNLWCTLVGWVFRIDLLFNHELGWILAL